MSEETITSPEASDSEGHASGAETKPTSKSILSHGDPPLSLV